MNKKVIVIGTGGHSKVVTEIIKLNGDEILGYLTSDKDKNSYLDSPVLGSIENYKNFISNYFIIAIGDNDVRNKLSNELKNIKWYTAIHPTALISNYNTHIGVGTVICAHAIVNPYAKINDFCIINTSAIIEHDCFVDSYTHISVAAKIAGNVSIGKNCFLGIGSTVINNILIASNTIIGAGSTVIKNITLKGTYCGTPAKRINLG